MKFSEFWELAVEQNPALANERMLYMDVEKFRQALKDAFDAGDASGYERAGGGAEVNPAERETAPEIGRRH